MTELCAYFFLTFILGFVGMPMLGMHFIAELLGHKLALSEGLFVALILTCGALFNKVRVPRVREECSRERRRTTFFFIQFYSYCMTEFSTNLMFF